MTGAPRSYQLVLDHIESDLAAGHLKVGGRLPAERLLAERYRVSRASVREAIRVLEAMGLVRTAAGSGPGAGAVLISEPAAPMGSALRWHLASRHLPVSDLVDARVLIESWALREAAGQVRIGSGADLGPARSLLAEMDAPELSPEAFLVLDTSFHVTLTAGAGNVVVAAMMSAMRRGIEGYVTAAVGRLPDWPATATLLRKQHAAIVEAVATGDPDRAAALVSAHIIGFYASTGIGQAAQAGAKQ